MKKETKELIEGLKVALRETAQDNDGLHWLNCKGNGCLSDSSTPYEEKILKGEYFESLSLDPESNYNKLMALFEKMEETEACLANGGLVRDAKGNWLKSGDKVRFIQHNRAGANDDIWDIGIVYFGNENLCWYLNTEEGDWLYLAHDYLEVETFEKFAD